jgi:anti-anti-sigma factor
VTTTPKLTRALRDLSAADTSVILDLEELTFVDSAGLHAILSLARRVPVVILNPTTGISRVFEILNLDEHVGIEVRRDTEPE